jgi:hypothetical protein
MDHSTPSSPDASDRQWYILSRRQEYEGEARANLLRIVGIGAFYVVELLNYYGLRLGPIEIPSIVDRPFHQAVTALAVAWTMVAMAVLLCLSHRVFPKYLKYLTTGADLVFLTCILMVADGPRSPLLVGYLLLIVLAGLRFNLLLVWFASAGAVAGYLFLLGYALWFTTRDISAPRHHQVIFLLAIVLSGVILGQIIRRVKHLAEDYAARTESGQEGAP